MNRRSVTIQPGPKLPLNKAITNCRDERLRARPHGRANITGYAEYPRERLRRSFILIATLIVSFPLISQADWTDIAKDLSYQKLSVPLSGRTVTLHAFKADPRKIAIRPVYAAENSTARKMAEKSGALVVANANFFDTEAKPLGLVVIDRQQKHPFKDISWWGVFCLKGRKGRIMPAHEYREGLCHQAVQAGPRLTINGGVPKLKDENSRKTAVGITPRGEVIITVSEQSLPIKDLAALFQRAEALGGLNCPNALNLDGGSSSQIYARTESFNLNVPSYVRFPVGLGVFTR